MDYKDLYKKEQFTSIHEAQAGLTKILKVAEKNDNFYRVMRNNKPIGVILPNKVWEDIKNLIEDLKEAENSRFLEELENLQKPRK